MMGVDEHGRRRAVAADHLHDLAVSLLAESAAAKLHRGGHPEHAQLRQTVNHRPRNIGLAVDLRGVDVRLREDPHGRNRVLGALAGRGVELRIGKEDFAPEIAPVERPGKPAPRGLGKEQLLGLPHLLGEQGLVVGRGHRSFAGAA